MDENKQPEKQDQAPLTAKKKRALLEYLAILCAGAFLIVALSLGIKLAAVQNDLEAADLGAAHRYGRALPRRCADYPEIIGRRCLYGDNARETRALH